MKHLRYHDRESCSYNRLVVEASVSTSLVCPTKGEANARIKINVCPQAGFRCPRYGFLGKRLVHNAGIRGT